MKKINKKYGTLFWITGISGSGKTSIAKKIHKDIRKKFGPTIMLSGDDLRKIFSLKGYSYNERSEIVLKYCKFAKFITDQKINVILAVIGMMDHVREWNRKNIKNYLEIYVKADLNKIIKKRKKKIYLKSIKNIVGLDIKPELPRKADISINNDLSKSIESIKKNLMKKIDSKIILH